MSRLIVVSNRASPSADEGGATSGGLAMALGAALKDGRAIWFGWSGETVDQYTGSLSVQRTGDVTSVLVDLEAQDRDEYYNGFANRTLWPLFHHRTDLAEYDRNFHEGYERVNERFARALTPLIQPDDLIWVQDYHLMPLAQKLRQLGHRNRIGFFLHIPWPARRLLATMPGGRDLVSTLFDYDLIGFQTADHRDAFADYVTHEAGGSSEGDTLFAFGKAVRYGVFPVGIDVDDFLRSSALAEGAEQYARLTASKGDRKMLLGVDRLDYAKGLEERFQAYERFLADNPEQHGRLFYLQIATPTRPDVHIYQDLKARLDGVSGRINGTYADLDWTPLRYVSRPYRRDSLGGVYRAADVAVVTPLRDGMNLVAKEFVAAQDPDDPGVLILSEFAGAADQMRQALIVNPFSREDLADAIGRAISMPLSERRSRWEQLYSGVRAQNVSAWRDAFVGALRGGEPSAEHDQERRLRLTDSVH